eukprot:scaffold255482_cov35-Prasinocladus_malaysianus.AAC.2
MGKVWAVGREVGPCNWTRGCQAQPSAGPAILAGFCWAEGLAVSDWPPHPTQANDTNKMKIILAMSHVCGGCDDIVQNINRPVQILRKVTFGNNLEIINYQHQQ